MAEAYRIAEEHSRQSSARGEVQYDRKTRGVILKPGDRVLVRNLGGQGGPGKLRSYWEKEIYVVKEQVSENPVYIVCPENGGNRKTRTLHRNLLLLVNDLPVEAPPKSPCSKKPAKERQTHVQTIKDPRDKERSNFIRDNDTTDSDEEGDLGGYWLRVPASLTKSGSDDPTEQVPATEQFSQVQRGDNQNQVSVRKKQRIPWRDDPPAQVPERVPARELFSQGHRRTYTRSDPTSYG